MDIHASINRGHLPEATIFFEPTDKSFNNS